MLPPPISITTAGRAADVDAVAGGQMNQPGLFGAGNDARSRIPVCSLHLGDEIAAVVRFADRRCRGRDDLVDFVGIGQPAEFGQGLERGRHGRRA